jgi:hypothetical protein
MMALDADMPPPLVANATPLPTKWCIMVRHVQKTDQTKSLNFRVPMTRPGFSG